MVVHVDLALEIGIDHLANWGRPVFFEAESQSISFAPPFLTPTDGRRAHTREPHHLDLAAELHEALLEQLDLGGFATPVQAFEHHESAADHRRLAGAVNATVTVIGVRRIGQ